MLNAERPELIKTTDEFHEGADQWLARSWNTQEQRETSTWVLLWSIQLRETCSSQSNISMVLLIEESTELI